MCRGGFWVLFVCGCILFSGSRCFRGLLVGGGGICFLLF